MVIVESVVRSYQMIIFPMKYKLNTDEYLKKIKKEGDNPVTPFVKERTTLSFIAIRNN